MALMESQCDIINDKIKTIFKYGENYGKNLSFDEKGLVIWYFQYCVNHKNATFMRTLNALDKLILKINDKSISEIIDGLLVTAQMEFATLKNEKKPPLKKLEIDNQIDNNKISEKPKVLVKDKPKTN